MAAPQNKVIITCAVTGSIHTPTMSPYLPITGDQVAEQAIGAAEAGASILHLHARNPDGSPTPDPKALMEFLPRTQQSSDAVVNITTGRGHRMPVAERPAAAFAARTQTTSLNMGPTSSEERRGGHGGRRKLRFGG